MTSRLYVFILFVVSMAACKQDDAYPASCDNTVYAKVKDLRGLDGCGFVFVLENGKVLEPYWQSGPLFNVQLMDGQDVSINYEPVPDKASACMAGELVKINCLLQATTLEN